MRACTNDRMSSMSSSLRDTRLGPYTTEDCCWYGGNIGYAAGRWYGLLPRYSCCCCCTGTDRYCGDCGSSSSWACLLIVFCRTNCSAGSVVDRGDGVTSYDAGSVVGRDLYAMIGSNSDMSADTTGDTGPDCRLDRP